MLAPGAVFRPHLERSPWMRFNVAVCEEPKVQRWLRQARRNSRDAHAHIAIGRPNASRAGGSGNGRARPA
jgi:hypothetical protein